MFIKNVIQALESAKVRYILVGGYAVSLHGAVRGTVDLDFVIALELDQFLALEKAFSEINLTSRLPLTSSEVFNFRQEYIDKRNLIAWAFVNEYNPLEMVDIIITHNADKMKSITVSIDNLKIKIASIDELIKMKKQSARPQDIEDIKALERLQ